MVFYLKYRPKNSDELDNHDISDLIVRYLSRPEPPHAFLFAGPKGTGKTSTARIVAKTVNCLKPLGSGKACGVCDVCLAIAKGSNLDVMEIDAASNRGIDEIRELREKIKLAPTNLKYKVYIIDEVHMLTNEAFNALLKTLEEPPRHALFVLATTEVYKIPDTILSRTVKVDFRKASSEQLVASLKRIVKGEKLKIDDEALLTIAQAADGSFRDGAKLLEELVLEGKEISKDMVMKKTAMSNTVLEEQLLDILHEKNAQQALILISRLVTEGVDIRQFFLSFLRTLQTLLLSSFEKSDSKWTRPEIIALITHLSQAFVESKSSSIVELPFELTMVEYCEATHVPIRVQPDVIAKELTATEETVVEVTPLTNRWNELLEKVKPFNHSLVGVLRSCRPIAIHDTTVTIEAAFKFHADRLNETKAHEILTDAVSQILGQTHTLKIVTKKRA